MKHRVRFTVFIAIGLVLVAGLAFFVSPHASSEPDGLDRVAIDNGFATREQAHPLVDGGASPGLAGLIGIATTFTLAGGVFVVVRRMRRTPRTT